MTHKKLLSKVKHLQKTVWILWYYIVYNIYTGHSIDEYYMTVFTGYHTILVIRFTDSNSKQIKHWKNALNCHKNWKIWDIPHTKLVNTRSRSVR